MAKKDGLFDKFFHAVFFRWWCGLLVGLALLAASGTGDIRDIALAPITQRKAASGMIGRLVAAMKGGF